MALTAANVDVAVTGLISVGPTSSTAPTSVSSVLTGFTDVGYISEDGVVISQPDIGDSTPIKAWQNGSTVRVVRALTDDFPTVNFTMMETSKNVVETYLDGTLTQTVTDGALVVDTLATATYKSYVIDVVDGSNTMRVYIPKGIITSREDITLANQEVIGYGLTLSCERNSTVSYNMKFWWSQLHS